jgi:hypothetical protein
VDPVIVALAVSLVVVGAIATYLDRPKRRRKRAPTFTSNQKVRAFLDADDRAFYPTLRPIAESEGLTILAKVRPSDMVEPRRVPRRRDPNADVLRQTRLDFVLSGLDDLTPVVRVNLDHRVERADLDRAHDQLIDAICHATELPLVRANIHAGFAEAEVVAQVRTRVRALSRLDPPLAA